MEYEQEAQKTTKPPAQHLRSPEQEPTEYWTYELFGCLSDWRLCIATFCVPCYTIARNAAYFHDDAMLTGALYGCGFLPLGPLLRWRTRQHRHLHGNMITDVAVHMCCPCCALIQENRELYGFQGSHVGEQIPLQVEISRK